jgi:hypothetical protein
MLIPDWMRRSYWATRFLAGQSGHKVEGGPLAGLRLPDRAFCSPPFPKRIGTYEMELIPWIVRILQSRPALVVDVGAAEGYYAVGLARLLPGSRVIAFEADAEARRLLGECVALNQPLGNVTIAGRCDAPALENVLNGQSGACVLIDAEGAEREILDPRIAPSLTNALILVELHDFIVPGIRTLLESRFAATHRTERIGARRRTVEDFPKPLNHFQRTFYAHHIVNALTDRGVEDMEWLLFTPRSE